MVNNSRQQTVSLAAQARFTFGAIAAAAIIRRLGRLSCGAPGAAYLDAALCNAGAALSTPLTLNFGVLLLLGTAAAILLVRLIVRLVSKAPVHVVDFTVHRPDRR